MGDPQEFSGNERFAILRRLGAGGMGTVYEAHDRERNTRVALKTLRSVDATGIYRFKIEFRALAELSHPNLLPLFELFCEDNQWFFTMELLEGASDLSSHVRGNASRLRSSASQPPAGLHPKSSSAPTSHLVSAVTSEVTSADLSCVDSAVTAMHTSDFATAPASDPNSLVTSADTSAEILFGDALHSSAPTSPAPQATPVSSLHGELDYNRIRQVFLTVAQGVHALHAAGKLHRDLKPENVMVRADGSPVLLDFGLILDLKPHVTVTTSEPGKPATFQATTDKTVSGTLAYMAPEQALGEPLQNSSDWYAFGVMLFEALTGRLPFTGSGVDMVRARLRQAAPRASQFASATPPDLDALCSQLLARDPARRPNSTQIFAALSGESVVDEDSSLDRPFFIGRESYLDSLNSAYARLERGQSAIVCVHGRSGVGKTTLIHRFLIETVAARGAVLLEGRCYEQESVPYKAVDNLIDALTQLLLEMPANDILPVLPRNIQSLARVFPVLRRVKAIGALDNAPTANDPLLVRRQAFEALGQLLSAIGQRLKLVLYIDDLQWGDLDSAQLLASVLAQQPSPRLLLLVSYRSEYSANDCLREFRRAWESGLIPSQEIEVLPLTKLESQKLAAGLLQGTGVSDAQIDRIVEQARGSAFFVQELAESARGGLDWQDSSSSSAQTTDLDEVLWRRVQKLPEDARVLLEIVAVAGQPIRFGELVHTRSLQSFPQHAVKALRTARLVRSTGSRLTDEIETFHDRVRESITRFLDVPVARDYHQQIADALEQSDDAAPETIASHLEAAQSTRTAQFYELAGERAIQVLAFDRAEDYLKHAARLAPTSADRVRIEVRLIHFYTDTARFQDAFNIGCDGAARLGFKLPRKFSPPVLAFNMLRGLVRKGRRKPSDLLNLPEMNDERLIAVVQLINAMAKAAYQVRPEVCVTICTIAVNLCLKYGNTPDAAIGYMVFGCIFLGGIIGRAQTGYQFGRLALALIEKYGNEKQRAEVNFVVGYFGTSWMRPAAEAEKLWQVAFTEGQRTGDLFHTGCAVSGTIQSLLMRGVPLDEIERQIDGFWPVIEQAHLREPMTCLTSTRRLIARLCSTDAPPTEDEQLLADLAGFGSRHFAHFHFLNQCMLHALTGNAAAAAEAAARSAAYLADSKGLLNTPEHFFWTAILQSIDPASKTAPKSIRTARKKFVAWAARCPDNFAVRLTILQAEEARLRNNSEVALRLYTGAASRAQQQGNLHLQAFATQRAASLAASLGRVADAGKFAADASDAFTRWGAFALATPAASHASGRSADPRSQGVPS